MFKSLTSLTYICAKEQTLFSKLLYVFHSQMLLYKKLNLNLEKSSKTAKYQEYQCDEYLHIKVIPSFVLFWNYLLIKETEHVGKAM